MSDCKQVCARNHFRLDQEPILSISLHFRILKQLPPDCLQDKEVVSYPPHFYAEILSLPAFASLLKAALLTNYKAVRMEMD